MDDLNNVSKEPGAATIKALTDKVNQLEREHAMTLHALRGFNNRSPVRQLTYHVLEQPGRICVYYTKEGFPGHFILYDSMDDITLG